MLFFVNFDGIKDSVLTKPSNCVIMLSSGLITAVLPYLFYTKGLENIESGKAAVVAAIEPVVAVIIGSLVFKDNLSPVQYFGIVLVILSICIQNLRLRNKSEG